MRSYLQAAARLVLALSLCGLVGAVVLALPLPDFRINAATGRVEVVVPVWTGTNYDLNHVIDPEVAEGSDLQITSLASNPLDDLDPRLTIHEDGSARVVWWRDGAGDEVLARKRSGPTGTWSQEFRVSAEGESSRKPRVASEGTRTWVAYQFDSGSQVTIAVAMINDEPDPIGSRKVLKTTSYSAVDAMVQAEGGHVWVTWVDSASQVGWSEYDPASDIFGAPAYQSFTQGDTRAARAAIRSLVLAP